MTLKEELEKYIPFNEQEEVDRENMIKYIDLFDDIYDRSNMIAHFTASAWVVNKDRTKVLMIYHNIYNSWSWVGGHADGDRDLLHVAMKELNEETGVVNFKPVTSEIFGLEIAGVEGHVKRGKYVSSHQHLNITYLIEVDELSEELRIKEDENSGVKWINVDDIKTEVSEKWMYDRIYSKYIEKVKKYKEL